MKPERSTVGAEYDFNRYKLETALDFERQSTPVGNQDVVQELLESLVPVGRRLFVATAESAGVGKRGYPQLEAIVDSSVWLG